MKWLLVVVALVITLTPHAEECRGHIFFYNLEAIELDAESDFVFFYDKVAPWLNGRGVSTSVHSTTPIKGETCFARDAEVSKDDLKPSPGYVLMKPNGDVRVFGGVMTDADLGSVANAFFD